MNAVHVDHLTVQFGAFKAVDDISFSVAPGEIFGFLGANGAGKTTTIRVLCGLLVPTSGDVQVAGLDLAAGADPIKANVGYMSQKFTLYNDLSVEENLHFAARLRKLPDDFYETQRKALLDFVGFKSGLGTLVRDLAGGIKQEISLVAALLHDPAIVFLDEPTAGVSPAARARFWALIRQLAGRGKTVFVTTHYMDEAEECGRIALMRAGRIIALDAPAALERQTFPTPLYEIEPATGAPADWVAALEKRPFIRSLKPYGRRYHAVIADEPSFQSYLHTEPATILAKPIRASLEDVFIELVEGADR